MNDRQLRYIVSGLRGKANGMPREDGFDITVASEIMAIFCLAEDLKDLKRRLGGDLFLGPSLIGVSIFMVVPFFVVIYYSMIDNPIRKNFVWFENFVKILDNEAFKLAASNTFRFSVIAVPLAVVLSLPQHTQAVCASTA